MGSMRVKLKRIEVRRKTPISFSVKESGPRGLTRINEVLPEQTSILRQISQLERGQCQNYLPCFKSDRLKLLRGQLLPVQDVQMRTFAVQKASGEVQASVSTFVNEPAIREGKPPYFGLFQAVPEVSPVDIQSLFEMALSGMRKDLRRFDCNRVIGPINGSEMFGYGVNQTTNVADVPTPLSYAPSHYHGLLVEAGFEVMEREIIREMKFAPSGAEGDVFARRVSRFRRRFAGNRIGQDISIRSMSRLHFQRDLRIFYDLYSQNLKSKWYFTHTDYNAFFHVFLPAVFLFYSLNPHWFSLVEVDGEPQGVIIVFPDINDIFAHSGGKLLSHHWLRILPRMLWGHPHLNATVLAVNELHRFGGQLAPLLLNHALGAEDGHVGRRLFISTISASEDRLWGKMMGGAWDVGVCYAYEKSL